MHKILSEHFDVRRASRWRSSDSWHVCLAVTRMGTVLLNVEQCATLPGLLAGMWRRRVSQPRQMVVTSHCGTVAPWQAPGASSVLLAVLNEMAKEKAKFDCESCHMHKPHLNVGIWDSSMLHFCRNRCWKMVTTQNNPLYPKVLQDSKMSNGSKGSTKTARTVVSTARGLCKMPGLDLRQICAVRSICKEVSLFISLPFFSNTAHFCLFDPFLMFLGWICCPF